MIFIEVGKVMVHAIGSFVTMERCIDCDEDYMQHRFFMCVRCLVTCSSGLGKRGWQHMWSAFLVVLLVKT
jgi:hypothetical protein